MLRFLLVRLRKLTRKDNPVHPLLHVQRPACVQRCGTQRLLSHAEDTVTPVCEPRQMTPSWPEPCPSSAERFSLSWGVFEYGRKGCVDLPSESDTGGSHRDATVSLKLWGATLSWVHSGITGGAHAATNTHETCFISMRWLTQVAHYCYLLRNILTCFVFYMFPKASAQNWLITVIINIIVDKYLLFLDR